MELPETKNKPFRGLFFVDINVQPAGKGNSGNLFSERGFLDERVESGLFPSGGIPLDDAFLSGLIETFHSLLQKILGCFDIACLYCFPGLLYGASEDSYSYFIPCCFSCGDPHVLLGGVLYGHSIFRSNQNLDELQAPRKKREASAILLYHGIFSLASLLAV